jgi:hypothetical protein
VIPHCFELVGTIGVEDVTDVRRFVDKLHRRFVHNIDDASRLVMATHELLENAVKFSADGTATLRIEIVDGAELCITTTNRARTADVETLITIAAELDAAPDAMAFYVELMSRDPRGQGGLGLGRVAAEGEMRVRLELRQDLVEVSAKARLSEPLLS